jgi:hypothetical protein
MYLLSACQKCRNLLLAIQLLIYIVYGDRTIIDFVDFVGNLHYNLKIITKKVN